MHYLMILLLPVAIWFFDIWPFYSGELRPFMRKYDYYVNFYGEDNKEEVLGVVQGIDACRSKANKHADLKNLRQSSWTYRCCRVVRDDKCARIEM